MLTKNDEMTSAMPSKKETIASIFSISFRIFSAPLLYHSSAANATGCFDLFVKQNLLYSTLNAALMGSPASTQTFSGVTRTV